MGIKLDPKVWHTRLFFWTLALCDSFLNKGYYWRFDCNGMYERYQRGTNLCHYIRVMTVYLPLVLATYALAAAATVYVLLVLPLHLFGAKGYAFSILWVVCIALAILTIASLFVLMFKGIKMAQKAASKRSFRVSEPRSERQPSAIELGAMWIAARKKNICPLVNFDRSTQQEG